MTLSPHHLTKPGAALNRGDKVRHFGIDGVVLNVRETEHGRYYDVATEYGPTWCHERELDSVTAPAEPLKRFSASNLGHTAPAALLWHDPDTFRTAEKL